MVHEKVNTEYCMLTIRIKLRVRISLLYSFLFTCSLLRHISLWARSFWWCKPLHQILLCTFSHFRYRYTILAACWLLEYTHKMYLQVQALLHWLRKRLSFRWTQFKPLHNDATLTQVHRMYSSQQYVHCLDVPLNYWLSELARSSAQEIKMEWHLTVPDKTVCKFPPFQSKLHTETCC